MAKLHLNLDQLKVESFETATARAGLGTVRANEGTQPIQCGPDSNLASCGGSCELTSCEDDSCYGCGGETDTCPTRNGISCVETGPAPDTCCQRTC